MSGPRSAHPGRLHLGQQLAYPDSAPLPPSPRNADEDGSEEGDAECAEEEEEDGEEGEEGEEGGEEGAAPSGRNEVRWSVPAGFKVADEPAMLDKR